MSVLRYPQRVIVGLIANPNASKDVRRLVGLARVVDVEEKANLVARFLRGLAAAGEVVVHALDDHAGLVRRAVRVGGREAAPVIWLPVAARGSEDDTRDAARLARREGARVLVVVGGDGTIRSAVEAWPEARLVPLAAGTNNALALADEPTVVGMAVARVLAADLLDGAFRSGVRLVVEDGGKRHTAVVDVVGTRGPWAGSGALWQPDDLVEGVVAGPGPTAVGVAAISAGLGTLPAGQARYLRFGPGQRVRAVFGPGLVRDFEVAEHRLLSLGSEARLDPACRVVALDGERKLMAAGAAVVRVAPGPHLFDPAAALALPA